MGIDSLELWVWNRGHRCRGPHRRVPLPVGCRLVVGRAPEAEVSVPVISVSRHHLEVRRDRAGVWVTDQRSRNGTYLNRMRISGPHLVKPCDSLSVEGVELRIIPAVKVDPAWLRWNDATVPRLARSIYANRLYLALPGEELYDNPAWFADLPILHDALLDAGCDDPDILDHCRAPHPHVRGCWALDLLLGQE
jgi:FHA domain-containing protein